MTDFGRVRGFRASLSAGALIALALLVPTALAGGGGGGSSWPSAGPDLRNTRFQNTESAIGIANVANLAVKWQFTTGGDVSATPSVDEMATYVPDWAGNLYAIDRNTGAVAPRSRRAFGAHWTRRPARSCGRRLIQPAVRRKIRAL